MHLYCTNNKRLTGSTMLWSLLFTEASSLGYIPASQLSIPKKGIHSKSYHSQWSAQNVCLYQLLDPIRDGTKAGLTVVSIGYIENPNHSTKEKRRDEKNRIEAVVK